MPKTTQTSQPQQESAQNPFAKLSAEFSEQLTSLNDKAADWEKQIISGMRSAASQSQAMAEQALAYSLDLAAASRKMAMDSVKRVTEAFDQMRAA